MRDNGTWRLTPRSTTRPGGFWLVGAAALDAGATARAPCALKAARGAPRLHGAGPGKGKIGNSMRNNGYKGCFCHSQEFVMGTILSLCNCSLENVLFLIKAT